MKLFCDNKPVVIIVHNLVQYDREKYVEIVRHFIKEKLDSKLINTTYIPFRHINGRSVSKGYTNGMIQPTCKFGIINIYLQTRKLEIINIFSQTRERVLKILH